MYSSLKRDGYSVGCRSTPAPSSTSSVKMEEKRKSRTSAGSKNSQVYPRPQVYPKKKEGERGRKEEEKRKKRRKLCAELPLRTKHGKLLLMCRSTHNIKYNTAYLYNIYANINYFYRIIFHPTNHRLASAKHSLAALGRWLLPQGPWLLLF